MQIQRTNYSPAFSARFTNNEAFREVAQYAKKMGYLRPLDTALNTIKKANPGEISIIHSKTPEGKIISSFTIGGRSVANAVGDATCPAEASFDGILELSLLGRKFNSLFGVSKSRLNISAKNIIQEYTV